VLDRRDAGEDEDDADLDGEPSEPSAARAPQWLVDFRSTSGKGFYQSLGDHAVLLAERSTDHLLVSFDNLSSARDEAMDRNPWGYDFVARNGWSQLGILAFRPSWFRDEALFAEMRRLADAGLFRRFRRVIMTGTSMGGYAACAFASLAPGCDVIAFSPQSTLGKQLVPWEQRFSIGRKSDWSGPFADGAEESRSARKVWLVYDPHFDPDSRHVRRFDAPNAVPLPARYSGHKSALFLRRAGVLSTVMRQAVTDELTPASFQTACRQGRSLPWFVNGLANRLIERRRAGLIPRLVAALGGAEANPIARQIQQRAIKAGLISRSPRPRRGKERRAEAEVHATGPIGEAGIWESFRAQEWAHAPAELPWQPVARGEG